jgi:hypothetical protein
MAVQRFSLFEEIVTDVKGQISDLFDKSRYTRQEIIAKAREAILTFNDTKGIASSRLYKYAFRAVNADDPTKIDRNIYENVNNITMDNELALDDSASEGSVETIASVVGDKQIALLTLYWNMAGSTNPPVLDVSFDKDHENGENLRGTFLADDTRINIIENGVIIDTSMIVARTFSVKWTLPASSDYVVKDTFVKIFLVDSSFMIQNQYDLARLTASNILRLEATRAVKDGQSESYVGMLKDRAEELMVMVQGKIGTGAIPASTAKGIDHPYDRTSFADKAFDRTQPDGTWVEIIGNEIIGRTVRWTE